LGFGFSCFRVISWFQFFFLNLTAKRTKDAFAEGEIFNSVRVTPDITNRKIIPTLKALNLFDNSSPAATNNIFDPLRRVSPGSIEFVTLR
jgi:hypothetical protein